MRYNINTLESIAQGKIQLKSANQWCEEHYGFNAFGFYNENQNAENGKSYFLKRMQEYLWMHEETKNVTSTMIDYIHSSKLLTKILLHWMFQTPKGKKENILNPKLYKDMCKNNIHYTEVDEKWITDFLSNPNLNNYLYEIYFRHYVVEFYTILKDNKYWDDDIDELPNNTSIYEALKKFYTSIWDKISNSVEILTEGPTQSEGYINQDIITSTGKPISSFNSKDEFVQYLSMGEYKDFNFSMIDERGDEYFEEMKNCNSYTWVDTDLNYCSTVTINYPEFRKFLKKKFKLTNGIDINFSFRAYYDKPIKTVEFVSRESKSVDSIILNIIPFPKTMQSTKEEHGSPIIKPREIVECNIKLLVEMNQYSEQYKNGGRMISLPTGDKNSLIVGLIPLKLILVRNLTEFSKKR